MQLNNIKTITAKIRLMSGLHIGAGDDGMHIGGIDNPVIKHPYTNEPYIPGSSLKGKIRSMLEWRAGVVAETKGGPLSAEVVETLTGEKREKASHIARLFGLAGDSESEIVKDIGPSRASFWDCPMNASYRGGIAAGEQLTESKAENTIDRISSTANNLRHTERVPADSIFDFRLSLKVLDHDDDKTLEELLAGLKLLEMDGLGGSGSRGYGKIAFEDMALDGEPLHERFAGLDPFAEMS